MGIALSLMKASITLFFVFIGFLLLGQSGSIEGTVSWNHNGSVPAYCEVGLKFTTYKTLVDEKGHFRLEGIKAGEYTLFTFTPGVLSTQRKITVKPGENYVTLVIDSVQQEIKEVEIVSEQSSGFGLMHLNSIDGVDIYAGKKNEVVVMDQVQGNLATNNSRQVYARVTGLNIWESDQAGLQLGIGGRGLSPNRTSHFNTRQNGYDIAADALGYPESYYTPPTEALQRIEVVRGAASLQYGTQFGGVLNFKIRQPEPNDPFSLRARQTLGSFGLLNSFLQVGGEKGQTTYNAFFNYKKGEGWKPRSAFDAFTAYGAFSHRFSSGWKLTAEYTKMRYLAQQPGGLTDAVFEQDPPQVLRWRNWFEVDWNVAALKVEKVFSPQWRMEVRNFGLYSKKNAVGILRFINRPDPGGKRELMKDVFRNWGSEARVVHTYNLRDKPANVLLGARYYQGHTARTQGFGSADSSANFQLNEPRNPGHSRYRFPSQNIALFTEHVLPLTDKWQVMPGIRAEYIVTQAFGVYRYQLADLAGNVLVDTNFTDQREKERSFLLGGIGVSYRAKETLEWYSNFSQNYRAINFNDIRVNNPNVKVDSNLIDESGFSFDFGVRGNQQNVFIYDVSFFFINYNNRIGSVYRKDDQTFRVYRYRTNIGNSHNYGLESFFEMDILKAFGYEQENFTVSTFLNTTAQQATYVSSAEKAFEGNQVEHVPNLISRSGITLEYQNLQLTGQFSYTSAQFSDATNTEFVSTAVIGVIPAYWVVDVSVAYQYKKFIFSAGLNNATNNLYFTRRAEGYPGPGILPAEPLNGFVTVGIDL